MKDKLVKICVKILRLLPSDGLHFNAIFRQTGLSYKPDIVEAISNLERGKLIMETKTPTHKQKRIKHPTALGFEFKRFMNRIEEFNETFRRFESCRKQNLDDVLAKGPSVLRSRGWTEEEIDLREETWKGTNVLRDILEKNIFNALVSRYAVLAAEIGNNAIAKDILTKIVTDEVLRQLLIIQGSYMPETPVLESLPGGLAFGLVQDIYELYQEPAWSLHNHHINKQARDVVISLLSLVIPEQFIKKFIPAHIPLFKHKIQMMEKKPPGKRGRRDHLITVKGTKELLEMVERLHQLP
jgi:hypothetical protein